jgi:predicted metal-binding membrane protein
VTHLLHLHGTEPPPGVGAWLLMTLVMMGPATVPGARHVARNSLRRRRARAVAEYAGAYLLVWLAAGLVLRAVVLTGPGVPGAWAFVVALLGAAAWQLTTWHARAERAAHRSRPLPLRDWRAERAATLFGVRGGVACVAAGWPLMVVMAAAPGGHGVLCVALAGVILVSRGTRRPRRTSVVLAVACAAVATAVAVPFA